MDYKDWRILNNKRMIYKIVRRPLKYCLNNIQGELWSKIKGEKRTIKDTKIN